MNQRLVFSTSKWLTGDTGYHFLEHFVYNKSIGNFIIDQYTNNSNLIRYFRYYNQYHMHGIILDSIGHL
jgi:hypothetical protein